MPSCGDRCPSVTRNIVHAKAIARTGSSLRNISIDIRSGLINAVNPTTNPMLLIYEPIALPMAMSGFPLRVAIIVTIISGTDVAKLTINVPINILGIEKAVAKDDDADTNLSPLYSKRNMLEIKIAEFCKSGFINRGCILC